MLLLNLVRAAADSEFRFELVKLSRQQTQSAAMIGVRRGRSRRRLWRKFGQWFDREFRCLHGSTLANHVPQVSIFGACDWRVLDLRSPVLIDYWTKENIIGGKAQQ